MYTAKLTFLNMMYSLIYSIFLLTAEFSLLLLSVWYSMKKHHALVFGVVSGLEGEPFFFI